MKRRDLFKGVAGLAAGLLLPASVGENAEAGRRFWALGAVPEDYTITLYLGRTPEQKAQLAQLHEWQRENARVAATLHHYLKDWGMADHVSLDTPCPKVRPIQRMKAYSDAHLRMRPFEEDWNAPGMEVYDTL